MKKSAAFFFTIFICTYAGAQKSLPQLGKNSVQAVIAAMTLEEKAHLVVGTGMSMAGLPASMKDQKIDLGSGAAIGETMDKVEGAAGTTFPVPRLGIPSIVVADGPAGLRIQPVRKNDNKTYYATAFPVATLLASSWDTNLVKKVGAAFGNEVHEYGVDIILAPALNIQRNPLGGRNFEYYSEDPLIAGSMTSAIVNGIQSNSVGTSVKHFAANNEEMDRTMINENISERALREIYLKGFEIAVKGSQPWTVMSSYNKINGIYTSENPELLRDILRKEWGFKGMVMTDWFGGKDAAAQVKAGNDLMMPGKGEQAQVIIDAVKNGTLDEKILDRNIAKMLNIILQSPSFRHYKFSNMPDLKSHAQISRVAASEGMVLLKNGNDALPFKNIKNVALFGNTSYDIIAGGTGSGEVNKLYTTSFTEGLINAGIITDKGLAQRYTKYIAEAKADRPKPHGPFEQPAPVAEMDVTSDIIEKQANNADIAIFTIGRNAGEGSDRKIDNDFNLSDAEKTLMKNIADAFHAKNKKMVVVLNIGGVIETASWRNIPDAILLAWQPGMEAGNAITDILTGKTNPSGKLAVTFPVNYTDVSSSKNFPGKEFTDQTTTGAFGMKLTPAEVTYEEGIYTGYRYFNTFNIKPAYEFGYGMSYTKFRFNNLKLSSSSFSDVITATISVKNTGNIAGKEVVQLYISAPANKLDKPAEELKAFVKTKQLMPGEVQTISLILHASDLASFDTNTSSWIAEAGNYTVKIGSSSEEIKQTADFQLANDIITEKDSKLLVPAIQINEMKK